MHELPHGLPVVQCRQHPPPPPPPPPDVNVGCGLGVVVRTGVAVRWGVTVRCGVEVRPGVTVGLGVGADGGTKNEPATSSSPSSTHATGEQGSAAHPSPPRQSSVTASRPTKSLESLIAGSTISHHTNCGSLPSMLNTLPAIVWVSKSTTIDHCCPAKSLLTISLPSGATWTARCACAGDASSSEAATTSVSTPRLAASLRGNRRRIARW